MKLLKIKKISSFFLAFIQILTLFTFINVIKVKEVDAATTSGWISFDSTTKEFQIKIEGTIPDKSNTYYEYDIIGFVVRYHRNDGNKYLTQIGALGANKSYGFEQDSYTTYTGTDGLKYEKSINSLGLEDLKKIFEQDFPTTNFSEMIDPTKNSTFYFDAIYSNKAPGESNYRGKVNSNRTITGEHFMTLEGYHIYNPDAYNQSSKYTSISSWDRQKGGIIGAKVYDDGRAWIQQGLIDIRNNYNKTVTVLGSSKPSVTRTVVTNYINSKTGAAIAPQKKTNHTISSTLPTHTDTAITVSGYTYLNYKTDTGGGLSAAKTGSTASISVTPSSNTHIINFYYHIPSNDKVININMIDIDTGDVISSLSEKKTITKDEPYSYLASPIDNYIFKGHKVNTGSGFGSSYNGSGRANLTLTLANSTYEINFYFKKNFTENIPSYGGNIVFDANSSDWEKSNISVTVSVSGDTEVTQTGTQSRDYSYRDRDWISGYYETVDGVEKWVPGYWGSYYTVYSSAVATYEQVWEIDKINVSVASAKDINGSSTSVSLSKSSISDGGTVTIQTEAKDIQLKAELSGWKEKSKKWVSASAPNGGTWGSTSVTSSTPKPTEKYTSTSGLYYLDKTKPLVDSITEPDAKWINTNKKITIKTSDNLSGLDNDTKIEISDDSHYNRSTQTFIPTHNGISNSKHNYTTETTLSEDGMYSIFVKLEDVPLNSNSLTKKTYKIDKTEPNETTFSDDDRVYIDDPLPIDITVSDNLSGIEKIEYVVTETDSYNNERKKTVNLKTTENVENDENTYTHTINTNGTHYIHVWAYDRAGNVTYTVSNEYKYFEIDPADVLINSLSIANKTMRGTRFDVVTTIDEFTEDDYNRSSSYYTMPNWVKDNVDKKVNGNYAITSGHGHVGNGLSYLDNNEVNIWISYLTPYGVPLTYDRKGNVIGNTQKIQYHLEYDDYSYGTKISKTITKYISIVPEQIVKTQITQNNDK